MKSGCSNFAKKSFSFYKMKDKCLKLGMYDGHFCFYTLHLFYLAYILTRLFLLLQVRIAVRVGARPSTAGGPARESCARHPVPKEPGVGPCCLGRPCAFVVSIRDCYVCRRGRGRGGGE